jgi:hypothetical protein
MEGYVGHHEWLVNNNLLTDEMKDNVAMCGYCLVEDVMDVSTSIDFNTKTVQYRLLLPSELYNNLKLLERFNSGESVGFFDTLKLKKFIKTKKENDETGMGYRLDEIGNKFIRAYLDKEWSVSVEIFKAERNEKEDFWLHYEGDKSSD